LPEALKRSRFEDDVEDARHAVRVVLRGRVRDHLDLVDDVRRQGLEVGGQLRAADRRRAPVDLDDDVLVAAVAHLAVGVDLHGGHGLEHVARVRGRRGDVLRAVRVAVGLDLHRGAVLDDVHRAERDGDPGELDGVEHHAGGRGRDLERAHLRAVAHGGHSEEVGAGTEPLDAERALDVGDSAGDQGRVAAAADGHGRAGDGSVALRVEDRAAYLAVEGGRRSARASGTGGSAGRPTGLGGGLLRPDRERAGRQKCESRCEGAPHTDNPEGEGATRRNGRAGGARALAHTRRGVGSFARDL
jgi:hypothetical protein